MPGAADIWEHLDRIKKIVMFEGDIETTAYFSRQMEKTFLENGYETFFYDYEKESKSAGELLRFLERGTTAVVSFNFHGLCGKSEVFYDDETKEYIWDDYEIPCFNIVVDHPFYYHNFYEHLPRYYMQFYIDKNHDRYMEEFFPDIMRGPFLPLAGTNIAYPYKPIKERSMDLVFTGNYTRPDTFDVYRDRHGAEYTQFYQGIIDELIEKPDSLLEDVARAHILYEIPDATEADVKETLGNMIFLDLYVRFYFRGEVMRTLAEAGFQVHLFGGGWEALTCSKPENLIIGGCLDSKGCLEKIADSKISINVMPWFKDGAHDRIFNTMLNGSVSLTDSSVYLDELLCDGKNAAVYNLARLQELPEKVSFLLEHPDQMQQIADSGYEMANSSHTWKNRACDLINILKSSEWLC